MRTLVILAIYFYNTKNYLLYRKGYNVRLFYRSLVIRRDRQLETLVAKDEIAKSFLRQREFADKRNDQQHVRIIFVLFLLDLSKRNEIQMFIENAF